MVGGIYIFIKEIKNKKELVRQGTWLLLVKKERANQSRCGGLELKGEQALEFY